MASPARRFTVLVFGTMMMASFVQAAGVSPTITVGTQEVGLTAGYLFSNRLTHLHRTKQQGPALMPSWMMTITDPKGTIEKTSSGKKRRKLIRTRLMNNRLETIGM